MRGALLIITLGALCHISPAKRIARPRQEASALSHGLIFSASDKDLLIEAGHWQHVFQINIPEQSEIVQFDIYPFESGWAPYTEPADKQKYSTYTDTDGVKHSHKLPKDKPNQSVPKFKKQDEQIVPQLSRQTQTKTRTNRHKRTIKLLIHSPL